MFLHPFAAFVGIAQDGDGDVADMELVAAAFLMAGDDDQFVAEAEGGGDIAGAHGEDALEIKGFDGFDAVLDAAGVHFGECFVDGNEGEGRIIPAAFMAFVGAEVTGEDGDEVRGLIFAAAHFAALFIDADGFGEGIARVPDVEIVIEVLSVIEEARGFGAVLLMGENIEEMIEGILELALDGLIEEAIILELGVEIDQLAVEAELGVLGGPNLITIIADGLFQVIVEQDDGVIDLAQGLVHPLENIAAEEVFPTLTFRFGFGFVFGNVGFGDLIEENVPRVVGRVIGIEILEFAIDEGEVMAGGLEFDPFDIGLFVRFTFQAGELAGCDVQCGELGKD